MSELQKSLNALREHLQALPPAEEPAASAQALLLWSAAGLAHFNALDQPEPEWLEEDLFGLAWYAMRWHLEAWPDATLSDPDRDFEIPCDSQQCLQRVLYFTSCLFSAPDEQWVLAYMRGLLATMSTLAVMYGLTLPEVIQRGLSREQNQPA